MENLNNQTTLEKGAQNVFKLAQKLKQNVHDTDIQIGEIQNEIARIKVDTLNTSAHNKELQATIDAYEQELKEKDKLIEKYEQEIRQRHDKIEKKQIYIARLNKKLEQLLSSQEDENLGPLEATIHNLQKEIANTEKQIVDMQKVWISTQTELVSLAADNVQQQDVVQELKAKFTILTQKKQRIVSHYDEETVQIRQLEQAMRSMHNDMSKLNDLIAKAIKLQEDLLSGNSISEKEYQAKLKDAELEIIQIEATIQRLREEKQLLLTEVEEIERQILLWQKKIELEKETQAALDPEYGQPEIRGMQKEIHRMRLRLSQLQRQQEKAIQEMERTISKQETIRLSQLYSKANSTKAQTESSVKKSVATLKQQLNASVKESKKLLQQIAKEEEVNSVLTEELEKQQRFYNDIEERKRQLQQQIEESIFMKHYNLQNVILFQKRRQDYDDALHGRLKFKDSKDKLMNELIKQEEQYAKIKEAVGKLYEENPKFSNALKHLMEIM